VIVKRKILCKVLFDCFSVQEEIYFAYFLDHMLFLHDEKLQQQQRRIRTRRQRQNQFVDGHDPTPSHILSFFLSSLPSYQSKGLAWEEYFISMTHS
jgi:hypothetical protein